MEERLIHNRNYKRLFFLLFFPFLFFALSAQSGYEVKKIKFDGNKTFKKGELLANMSIYEIGFLQRLTKKKEPYIYNAEFVEKDLERLIRFYQSEGFLYVQAKVDTFDVDDAKRTVNVRFIIKEKKPIMVDSVVLACSEKCNVKEDSIMKKLSKKFILKKGKRFQDMSINQDIVEINKGFQNKGYAYAKTRYALGIDTAAKKTNVFYYSLPGTIATFGSTTVTGNKRTDEKLIRRQLNYQKGETYDAQKLDRTRRDLYDLQVFRIISVIPQKDENAKEAPIPVNIILEEMPKISTQFGVGYGTEDKFRTFIDLTYRGIFRDASRLNLFAKHSALEPYHVSLKLTQPRFLDKKTSITINPYFRRQIEPGFDTQTLGLNIPLIRKFSDQLNASLTYYFERVGQKVQTGDVDVPNPESRKFLYNKSGLMTTLGYSNALPRFSPETGFAASLGFKFNGYFLGGDFSYTKLWLDVRKYHKAGNFVIALRGMAGGIHSSDSTGFIPVEERFYSGGSNSVRGWARAQLGPKRETGTPLGGKSIIEMSAEVRHPLFWKLDGAVFVDVGNVWTTSYVYRVNQLAYTAGVGLRYSTPIGPVRFDVGIPVGNEKKRVQLFLSIGQAF